MSGIQPRQFWPGEVDHVASTTTFFQVCVDLPGYRLDASAVRPTACGNCPRRMSCITVGRRCFFPAMVGFRSIVRATRIRFVENEATLDESTSTRWFGADKQEVMMTASAGTTEPRSTSTGMIREFASCTARDGFGSIPKRILKPHMNGCCAATLVRRIQICWNAHCCGGTTRRPRHAFESSAHWPGPVAILAFDELPLCRSPTIFARDLIEEVSASEALATTLKKRSRNLSRFRDWFNQNEANLASDGHGRFNLVSNESKKRISTTTKSAQQIWLDLVPSVVEDFSTTVPVNQDTRLAVMPVVDQTLAGVSHQSEAIHAALKKGIAQKIGARLVDDRDFDRWMSESGPGRGEYWMLATRLSEFHSIPLCPDVIAVPVCITSQDNNTVLYHLELKCLKLQGSQYTKVVSQKRRRARKSGPRDEVVLVAGGDTVLARWEHDLVDRFGNDWPLFELRQVLTAARCGALQSGMLRIAQGIANGQGRAMFVLLSCSPRNASLPHRRWNRHRDSGQQPWRRLWTGKRAGHSSLVPRRRTRLCREWPEPK
jgi:hypothetical protein